MSYYEWDEVEEPTGIVTSCRERLETAIFTAYKTLNMARVRVSRKLNRAGVYQQVSDEGTTPHRGRTKTPRSCRI